MITPDRGVVIAQRYALVRPLASGGMGSVWVARHRELEVDVTVKFMAPALIASAEARARFEREARAAARLDSQHVVHVHDYGVEDGTPYMVMELLKGDSLWTRLSQEGRLPLSTAARLAVQICKALRTAHEAGLVHRDLKPGNVFLARKDEEEVVKILDFGIAKTADLGDAEANTETGALLGSVHYMSPEQIRSSRGVDHRSDLWSVGVILYRVLSGRLPFPGEKLGDVLVRVCTDPFPPLSSVAPDLPARVDQFFARALDRDPDRRFQSAMEMAEAFSATALETPLAPSSRPAPPAHAAPQPSPAAPQPSPAAARWKMTVPMGQLPRPQTSRVAPYAARGGTVPLPPQALVARPEAPRPASTMPYVAEPGTGTIPAVLMPDPGTQRSAPPARAPGGNERAQAHGWWVVGALSVVVVGLVAVIGVALRSGTTSPSAPAMATASSEAPAPAAETAAPVPTTTAGAPSASAVDTGAPAATEAPRAAGSASRAAGAAAPARPAARGKKVVKDYGY